jgi:hypothetical protein
VSRLALAAGLFATALMAPIARAETTAKTWNELPKGTLAPPPTKTVAWVSAHEKVADFHVLSLGSGGGDGHGLEVFASEEEAKAVREGKTAGLEGCFTEAAASFGASDLSGTTWEGLGDPHLTIWTGNDDAVRAVHAERLVEDDTREKATLEVLDAWVDVRTRGARVIGRSTLPLVRVGGALQDLRVYAAREETSSKKMLHVVVKKDGDSARIDGGGIAAFELEGRTTPRGTCGHARVSLRADSAHGDVGLLRTTVSLPPIHKEAAAAAAVPPNEPQTREIRARELEVQIGASQTSRDAVPVATVSFGWAGREQQLQNFTAGRFVSKKKARLRKK